jgi:hypothetical protein
MIHKTAEIAGLIAFISAKSHTEPEAVCINKGEKKCPLRNHIIVVQSYKDRSI